MSNYKFLFVFVFLLVNQYISGQQIIDSNSYLANVIEETATNRDSGFMALYRSNFKTPIFEQINFRTETDEFDFERQRYTFRVRPANRRLFRMQTEIFNQQVILAETQTTESKDYLLRSAYENWVAYSTNTKELSLQKKQLSILKDIWTVYEKKVVLPSFDVTDLLEAEDDYQKTEWIIKELTIENRSYSENMVLNENSIIDTSNLITISQIRNLLANIDQVFHAHQHADYFILQERQKLNLLEKELEIAESKQWLDFAQIEYRGPHNDDFDQRVSIGIGINIPTRINQVKIMEYEINQLEEELDFKNEIEERNLRVIENRQEMVDLLKQYDFLLQQEEESKYSHQEIIESHAKSGNTSPLLLLKIKQLELKRSLRIIDLEKDILEAYIEWLYWSGKMTTQPYINYLSTDLNVLSN